MQIGVCPLIMYWCCYRLTLNHQYIDGLCKSSFKRAKKVGTKALHKQRVLMHGHQGWNVRHGLCHIYMIYIYIYIWVVYSLCFFCCLFITVTWWYVRCFEWASGNQEEVQASPWRIVTVPGVLSCCVKVSGGEAWRGFLDALCQCIHLYLKQIIKIEWANIHENNRPLLEINYRTYTNVVTMDPPNTFLVQNHTKCSSPINYLFYGRLYHKIVYIIQGKWYLNRYIIVSRWHWDITKVTRDLLQ